MLNQAHNPKAPSPKSLLAVSVKPKSVLSKRARQLLSIERSYWLTRGVDWILFTPDLYVPEVKKALERISPWTTKPVSNEAQQLAAAVAREFCNLAYRDLLTKLEAQFGSSNESLHALWQSVWNGLLPLDLKQPWHPTRSLKLLNQTEFNELNPVACRRSSWNS